MPLRPTAEATPARTAASTLGTTRQWMTPAQTPTCPAATRPAWAASTASTAATAALAAAACAWSDPASAPRTAPECAAATPASTATNASRRRWAWTSIPKATVCRRAATPSMRAAKGPAKRSSGWSWNGTACEALSGCSCAGADCGRLYGGPDLCMRAHAECLPTDCEAMDARGEGLCDAFFGYAWNGVTCVGISGCSCVGTDCGSTYSDNRRLQRCLLRVPWHGLRWLHRRDLLHRGMVRLRGWGRPLRLRRWGRHLSSAARSLHCGRRPGLRL